MASSLCEITVPDRGPSFEEYLAGGFLGNAPILFFTYALKCLLPDERPSLVLEIASALIVALGGIISGYLVIRRVDRDHLHIGLRTGLSAFFVNFALSSILFEGTTILYGLFILLIFCFASVMGAYLRRITTRGRRALQIGTRSERQCSSQENNLGQGPSDR